MKHWIKDKNGRIQRRELSLENFKSNYVKAKPHQPVGPDGKRHRVYERRRPVEPPPPPSPTVRVTVGTGMSLESVNGGRGGQFNFKWSRIVMNRPDDIDRAIAEGEEWCRGALKPAAERAGLRGKGYGTRWSLDELADLTGNGLHHETLSMLGIPGRTHRRVLFKDRVVYGDGSTEGGLEGEDDDDAVEE